MSQSPRSRNCRCSHRPTGRTCHCGRWAKPGGRAAARQGHRHVAQLPSNPTADATAVSDTSGGHRACRESSPLSHCKPSPVPHSGRAHVLQALGMPPARRPYPLPGAPAGAGGAFPARARWCSSASRHGRRNSHSWWIRSPLSPRAAGASLQRPVELKDRATSSPTLRGRCPQSSVGGGRLGQVCPAAFLPFPTLSYPFPCHFPAWNHAPRTKQVNVEARGPTQRSSRRQT